MFSLETKILVIDDMLTMRKIVMKTLKEMGYTDIEEAANGQEGWEKLQSGSFGLVVSDWNMPVCTGLDLLKRVRADGKLGKLPFILVTAEAEQQQVAAAIKSGVDQYVVKPFSKESLMGKLELAYKKCALRKAA